MTLGSLLLNPEQLYGRSNFLYEITQISAKAKLAGDFNLAKKCFERYK